MALRVQSNQDGVEEGVYYLLSDHLGGTTLTLDVEANKVAELRYAAWGETRYTDGDTPTQRRYTGQIEAEAGLYFYQARWYDPALGRFAQADTVMPEPGSAKSFDRYAYVYNNPMNATDPSGHIACWDEHANDPGCGNTNNQSQGQANLSTTKSGDTPISDFIIEKIPFSSQDWVITATTFDALAEIADIYAVYIVIYGTEFGAGIALPFVAAGAPEVPIATGFAGAMIAELYAQPAIKVGNAFATLSTASTFVSETKAERTIIEQGKISPATLNSISLTILGWIAPSEAFLSFTIQSFALTNDFGFTSLPFPSR